MFIFHIFNFSVTISKNDDKPEVLEHQEHVKKVMNELVDKRDTFLYMYS